MSAPTVSIITPTFNRERHLRNLIDCALHQTRADLELLILDDSPRPSRLIEAGYADDPRVRYIHSERRLSIGEKRNRLVEQSRGQVIVQFDDDDFYAPRYVERMVAALEDRDLVKLGGWFGYSVAKRQFFYWDTTKLSPIHFVVGSSDPLVPIDLAQAVVEAEFVDKNMWGYGFSYVVRRSVFEKVRFADENFGEDYSFVQRFRQQGLKASCIADAEGLALHVIHASNTSRTFPQFLIPPAVAEHLFGGALASYLDV
jgi:glycosyltransferase involved in cell wall biosynthesis